MNTCDLHTHSTFSDGTLTPSQLVSEALAHHLRAVALTDHNTIAGVSAFLEAAKKTPLQAIAGVEISTGYLGKDVHILGLFLKQERYEELDAYLAVINQRKEESNLALLDSLNRAGFDLHYAQIRERHQGNVNRAVIASEMLRKGYIRDIQEAFQGVLSPKNGYYVPPEYIPAFDAVAFLHSIHAVPVLAHPLVSMSEKELRAFLPEAKRNGLAAMETRYSTYSPETAATAQAIAQEFGLLESGGSDFHGDNKPCIQLGSGTGALVVPYMFAQRLWALTNRTDCT